MSDQVNHPKHYTEHPSGVECIQVTEHMNFCLGNAIKYIWRAGQKGEVLEDLKKARWYIDREIQRLEGGAKKPEPAHFEVHEQVRVLSDLDGYISPGTVGRVFYVDRGDFEFPYHVRFDSGETKWFKREELERV